MKFAESQKLNEMAMSHGEILNAYSRQGKSITIHYLCLLILSEVLGNKGHWSSELNEFLSYVSKLKWTEHVNQRIAREDAGISLFYNYLNYIDDLDEVIADINSKESVNITFSKNNEEYNKLKILNNFREFTVKVLDKLYSTKPSDEVDYSGIIEDSSNKSNLKVVKSGAGDVVIL